MNQPRRDFAVLWAAQFVTTAGLTVVVPLLPLFLEDQLGATGSSRQLWTGAALAAPAVTLAVASRWWGRAGDRWGRKVMVVRALVGLAVAVVGLAVVATPLQLLVCRLAQGAFGGVADAAAAFATDAAPSTERGRVLGRLQTGVAAGALVGPLAGGVLAAVIGLRSVLLAAGLLVGLCALAAATLLSDPAAQRSTRAATSPDHRPAAPTPGLRAVLLAGACGQAAVAGLVSVFAPHVRDTLDDPANVAAWVGALQAVTWCASLLSAGWWGRRNDRRPVEASLAVALAGTGAAIVLQARPAGVGSLIPLRLAQGWCFSAVGPGVMFRSVRGVDGAHHGVCIGTANRFLVAGQVAGALGGAGVSAVAPTGVTVAVLGVVAGGGALLAVRAGRGGRP